MKRFFVYLTFFSVLALPGFVLSAEPEDCDADTIECYCPAGLSIDDVSENPLDPLNALTQCETLCENEGLLDPFSDVSAWALQCRIGGTLTALGSGDVSAATEAQAVIDEFVPPPRLGIEIPGFDTSLSSSAFGGDTFQTNVLGQYVEAIYGWLISAGAMVAILLMMIGGLEYTLARGEQGRIRQAKNRIVAAITGLVLLLGAYTVAYLIDPNTVAFDTLELRIIDPVEYVANSGDTPGKLVLTPGSGAIPEDIKCGSSYSVEEIAKSTVGNITYRFGGKGGPAPYQLESKVDSNGVAYSSYCPEGTACFDCSGYVDFLAECADLKDIKPGGGTSGIFNSGLEEKVTSCTKTSINETALNPGDLLGWASSGNGHVYMYIGNGQVADSHGGNGRNPGNAVGIYSTSVPCNNYMNTDHGLYVVRRPQ